MRHYPGPKTSVEQFKWTLCGKIYRLNSIQDDDFTTNILEVDCTRCQENLGAEQQEIGAV